MNRWVKISVLILLGLAVIIILMKPDIGFGPKYKKFQTTPNASAALDNSLKRERPIFLEFYAKW